MYRSSMCMITPHRKQTWFEKRTNLEKQFLIIFAITFFILIVLITFMFSLYLKYGFALRFIRPVASLLADFSKLDKDALLNKLVGGNICMTPHCVSIASQLLDGMNKSIKPCDDFYEMTCSNWINKHTIPGNRGDISNFDKLNYDISQEMKRIFEDELPKLKNNQIYRNLYDFSNICNNMTRLEIEKDNELKDFIEHKLGGWPMAQKNFNEEEKLDLIDFHRKLDEHGYPTDGLIQISTFLDVLRNVSRNTILISPPTVSLHHNYLIRNSSDIRIKNYFNLIRDAIQIYNPDHKIDNKQIWNLINFERRLSSLSRHQNKMRNIENLHKGKISDLFLIEPRFPWNEFLKFTYEHDIPSTQNMIYTDEKYLSEFFNFINSTETSLLKNYLVWRVVRNSIRLMDSRWSKIIQNFFKQNLGFSNQQQNRTQFCYSLVYATFYHLIDHLYLKSKPELSNKKNKINEVARAIHKQFRNNLKDVEWFDDEARVKAISKASKISLQIGYPDELLSDKPLVDYYSKIMIESNSSFYKNMLLVTRWYKRLNYQLLNTVYTKNDWRLFGPILTVNAFYSRHRNTVILPIGILGRHVYSEENPNYMNFASLGYIIAHELTHSFDEQGSKVDANGHFDWWKPEIREAFQKRVECVIENYSNYTVYENIKLRVGKETLNENLADIGGAKIAFYTYRNYLKDHNLKNEYRIPGLQEFNNEQLFWIFYANTWCRKTRAKQTLVNTELSHHSLAKYRVIGVLSNSQEFADSFKCEVDTKMNPRKKCTIW